jgi:hypothetical protein
MHTHFLIASIELMNDYFINLVEWDVDSLHPLFMILNIYIIELALLLFMYLISITIISDRESDKLSPWAAIISLSEKCNISNKTNNL